MQEGRGGSHGVQLAEDVGAVPCGALLLALRRHWLRRRALPQAAQQLVVAAAQRVLLLQQRLLHIGQVASEKGPRSRVDSKSGCNRKLFTFMR